ncbi:2'-5' RNA ligase family protein [Bacillus multifaciens]|uniref:2'-5' RNA ligase family protein n=1 Tax=Bacillus multifaciens TaxID=3068506 RepID=UPI0027407B8B|nr:2'-5' RNA ligase family protein [Bacillus sp. WLY-B-L8]MDP7978616.1 2'-5' RNA ligase family protein [Bacillus sp. WLY-B-L8]HDX9589933.1 2'-5' RNA ligase family protein [Bacillus pseudomycoides]
MMQRTILIFLNSGDLYEIEGIRRKHDPLFGLIPPHITLVFPFISEVSNERLEKHIITNVSNMNSFHITLNPLVTNAGEYLFLIIEEGKENIIELHNKLYSDFLQPFLHKEIPYFPHVTVGRKNDKEMALRVIKNLPPLRDTMRFTIDKIVVESIGENEESIIEFEVQLPTK